MRTGGAGKICLNEFCLYFPPLVFPHVIEAGICVAKMGSSRVRYEIGFYVDPQSRRPVTALPLDLKQVLEKFL
jgi:acyl-CoA thioester hydrolase